MRGYLVHISNENENNFIRDAIDNDSGITFHGQAGLGLDLRCMEVTFRAQMHNTMFG